MEPQATPQNVTPAPPTRRFKLPSIWKIACLLLLIALAVCIVLWKPWQANIKASDRTINVTGNATIKAEPDEYIFSPSYEIKNSDPKAALAALTQKNNDIIAKLKALGVASNKIKSDASNYKDYYEPDTSTYTFNLTITVDDKTLAQKVQDYLLTTSPNGAITPEYTFTSSKQKQLESQGRDQAEKDARAKADQSAKNLGFKVKAVKSVQDGSFEGVGGCGGRGICVRTDQLKLQSSASDSSLTLQPGQNDLPYSVSVTYYIN